MKIAIAGGTGFIGRALVSNLCNRSHRIVVLTRNTGNARTIFPPAVEAVEWDGNSGGEWSKHIDGADAVINLSGETIAGRRWSKAQKARICRSRIDATRAIVG